MTDAEIIKALECCLKYETSLEAGEWCNSCPLYDDHKCLETLPLNALDLITRQKAEIEQWQGGYMTQKQEIANLEIELKAMRGAANSFKAEIERLKENLNIELENYATEYDNKIKAEAYKEVVERLCEDRVSNDPVVIAAKCLLKEMEGENDEQTKKND